MVYQRSLSHQGVILLRLKRESQEAIIRVLENALTQLKEEDLKGKFTVITEEKIRIRGKIAKTILRRS